MLAAAWVATWRPQVDPDAWWHLALGDRILATVAIPSVEPISWLTTGDRFVPADGPLSLWLRQADGLNLAYRVPRPHRRADTTDC